MQSFCGLKSRQPGKHRYRITQRCIAKRIEPTTRFHGTERIWFGDISSIRMQDKWYNLALVVDLYARQIVGSALSLTAKADLVCRAIRNAQEARAHNGRPLFHSEQDSQYKNNKYRKLLWKHGVMQSMSLIGNCLDDSPIGRVFRILKRE